ncbi:MAG: aminoacyl-histidine dipeptidase [Lachnospiraceae bacterium]|nr:aminoacyl-histidine dipeptidase [Lachnospiraceae bacterium]
MRVLESLNPERVFFYFEEIAGIPHGSGNTEEISAYLVRFAEEHDLRYRQDEMGNVIIWKAGLGDKAVIIQGHMDMVCEKEAGCTKDMSKEALDLYIDGEEIKAKGTTLGGDDGIAVAMALALLESEDKSLPPIEAIFTVDEEIGMLGAATIDVSGITGRVMLNIDSEAEGIFTVSCAGGVVANASYNVGRELIKAEASSSVYRLTVDGLIGGHSGIEIHKNRANAIVLLGRLLQRLRDETDIRIADITGGAKDNAIAVSAKATVVIKDTAFDPALAVKDFLSDIKGEYATVDPDINVGIVKETVSYALAFDKDSTDKVIYMLCCLPNGIQRMSPDVEGLVQTSLNMGILKTLSDKEVADKEKVVLTFCVRSSVSSEKRALMSRLRDGMDMIGGTVEFAGDYPGWQYRVDSPLRETMKAVYITQYHEEPVIEAVHAGVECGFFAAKLPGLDCVSIGPNLSEIHTFRESMNIPSVARTYELVLETLHHIASGKSLS